MEPAAPQTPEVDLHRLDLRFADARLLEPRAIEALARPIEQSGTAWGQVLQSSTCGNARPRPLRAGSTSASVRALGLWSAVPCTIFRLTYVVGLFGEWRDVVAIDSM